MESTDLLSYYASPGVFTTVEGFEDQVEALLDDVASVVAAVQGLLIHEAWAPAYGVTLSSKRVAEKELHGAVAMLHRASSMDTRPLSVARSADCRVVSVCRHFATLFVAFMRQKGVPARVRSGFANYFESGVNGDHWVGEYWNAKQGRWVLVDEQLDELQRNVVKPDFDTLDVPRDRFLVAGDAWHACRSGGADPQTFGVGSADLWGLEEVMGAVFLDLAALQKVELLPWNWYGLAKQDGAWELELNLIDRLAALSTAADAAALTELQELVARDRRLALPKERVTETLTAEMASLS